MPKTIHDVYGVGNAIIDTEIQVSDEVVIKAGLKKGTSALATLEDQVRLFESLPEVELLSTAGGSVANTLVCVARLGGQAYFLGKVGDDEDGVIYRRSLRDARVGFSITNATGSTGTCLVLVTPDGERTMQTNLAAANRLNYSDVDSEPILQSRIVYVEGYLWGNPSTATTAEYIMSLAQSSGVPVAISFSDPALIGSFGQAIKAATRKYASIVFCNESEAQAYANNHDSIQALYSVAQDCHQVFMTCGKEGSMVLDRGRLTIIDGYEVPATDTTGAGDAYAAGVLYGLTHSFTATDAGKIGSFISARMVTELGPRLGSSMIGRVPAILEGAHPLDMA